jgi:hypothetical protein
MLLSLANDDRYDPGVVRVVADIGIELLGFLLEAGGERLDLAFGNEDAVRRHAGLAAIGELAVGDAPRSSNRSRVR